MSTIASNSRPERSGLIVSALRDPRFAGRSARSVVQAKWSFRHATELGDRVRVSGRPRITNKGILNVGPRVQVISKVATTEIVVNEGATLTIGEAAYINYGCSIASSLSIEIGPRCNIGTYVMIMDNDFHRLDPERRNERPESSPIVLGENVWIGGRAIILNGVTIGDHSVIGAGSVVTTDVPPRTIAAGVPAKIIKSI